MQSFPEDTNLTPQEVHEIGLEFAARQFPDYEVLVATHCDTDNLHNHLLVNSVSFKTGKKLHQNHDDLVRHRKANDEICLAHGQPVLESYRKGQKKKRALAGEYRTAEQDIWIYYRDIGLMDTPAEQPIPAPPHRKKAGRTAETVRPITGIYTRFTFCPYDTP